MAKHGRHTAIPENPKPSMNLDGREASSLSHLPLGSRLSTTATGRLTSISRDRYNGKTSHNARIEFDRVRHTPAGRRVARKRIAKIRAGA